MFSLWKTEFGQILRAYISNLLCISDSTRLLQRRRVMGQLEEALPEACTRSKVIGSGSTQTSQAFHPYVAGDLVPDFWVGENSDFSDRPPQAITYTNAIKLLLDIT